MPADERIVRRLLEICDRYVAVAGAATGVYAADPEDAVGELAGASRPTTDRVLRGLAADGVVTLHRGSIEVLDLKALARRAAP